MARLSRFQLGQKLSAREKIEGSGYEALLGPDVTDDNPARTGLFLFELSNDGYNSLVQMASFELLEQQRENWILARRTGNDEPLQDDLLADLSSREAYYEVMKGEKLQLIGTLIYHNLDPETGLPLVPVPAIPVYQIDLSVAEDNDYPVPVKVAGKWPDPFHDKSPYLVIHVLKPPKGDKGEDGEPGQDGADGQDGQDGAPGEQGPPGICEECGPGGQPDGGGGGVTGGTGGGSGPNGSPNPDGNDILVRIKGCPDPIINFPYCSESFSFDHASIKGAIIAAVTATGHFDSSNEELISVVLGWDGAAYGGVTVTVDTGEEAFNQSGGNIAGVLTVVDTDDNEFVVPHDTEEFGVTDVLVVEGYHYHGTTGLRMDGDGDVTLTGEMSTYPILGTGNCHNPPGPEDPAWLQVCLRQFVKHGVAITCRNLPLSQNFIKANYPYQFASPLHQTGWVADTWPDLPDFDNRVETVKFHPPVDGLANHLRVRWNGYDANGGFTIDLFDRDGNHVDGPQNVAFGGQVHTTGGAIDYYDAIAFTGTYAMRSDRCYSVRIGRLGGNVHTTCYFLGVSWAY